MQAETEAITFCFESLKFSHNLRCDLAIQRGSAGLLSIRRCNNGTAPQHCLNSRVL